MIVQKVGLLAILDVGANDTWGWGEHFIRDQVRRGRGQLAVGNRQPISCSERRFGFWTFRMVRLRADVV
jgi:hypothetical protein